MEHVNAEAGGCGGSRCTEVFAGGAESCGPATKRCSDSPDPARFSLSVTEGHHGHQRVQVANVRLGGGGDSLKGTQFTRREESIGQERGRSLWDTSPLRHHGVRAPYRCPYHPRRRRPSRPSGRPRLGGIRRRGREHRGTRLMAPTHTRLFRAHTQGRGHLVEK